MTDSTLNPVRRLPLPEFIGLMAILFATIAFSIDAMLPALPEIAAELVPDDVNSAQLVLTSFMMGMGIGTLFAGPISDALGRKLTISLGLLIYIAAAFGAHYASSLESLLVLRVLQGLGAASPRIVGLALVRDLYQGREMARISSFVMMVFIMVPALAPAAGQLIINIGGWRAIFLAFIALGLFNLTWLNLRQAETLAPPARRPLAFGTLIAGAREVLSDRQVMICMVVMTLGFGQMFALLASAQQLFGETYHQGDRFPVLFAAMALLASVGTILNMRYVVQLGMRRIAKAAYMMQIVSAALFLTTLLTGILPEPLRFPAFFLWAVSVFAMAGVTFGNLNALAMQRMGHIAGMTASIVSAFSTLGAILIAAPVGLMFNGTAIPVASAALICSSVAWLLMRQLED
ncbi:multidrug effflux MFS transporter [Paracoccus pacificus]|uniref:Multidrug effflux MFS transporter n=1 Tax=Paracoccus pacificus TaxID=1463598 RepID=A0ABW4R4N9_9RHOB